MAAQTIFGWVNTWAQGDQPGAGSQAADSSGVNGNWWKFAEKFNFLFSLPATVLKNAIIGAINLKTDVTDNATLTQDGTTNKLKVKDAGIGLTQISSGAITWGTYTPTLTNIANLDGSVTSACQYMRIGNVVTVSGKVVINPTTTLTYTALGISLPIVSNFGNDFECAGVAAAPNISDNPAAIIGDTSNDRAQLDYVCVSVVEHAMFFTFTYQVK